MDDESQWFLDGNQIVLLGPVKNSETIQDELGLQGPGEPIDIQQLAKGAVSAAGLSLKAASVLAEQSGRVWVLTEESRKLFQSQVPSVSADGFHYGSVKNMAGKYAGNLKFHVGAHAKWLNPQLLAGVGGVLSGLMVEYQNAEILRTLQDINKGVQDLDRRLDEQWRAKILSTNAQVTSARKEFEEEGILTEDRWKHLSDGYQPLQNLWREVEQRVSTHTLNLEEAKSVAEVQEHAENIASKVQLWVFLLVSAHALLVAIEKFQYGRLRHGDIGAVIRARDRFKQEQVSRVSSIKNTLEALTDAVAHSRNLSSGKIMRNVWRTPRLDEAFREINSEVTKAFDVLNITNNFAPELTDIDRRAAVKDAISQGAGRVKGAVRKVASDPNTYVLLGNGIVQIVTRPK